MFTTLFKLLLIPLLLFLSRFLRHRLLLTLAAAILLHLETKYVVNPWNNFWNSLNTLAWHVLSHSRNEIHQNLWIHMGPSSQILWYSFISCIILLPAEVVLWLATKILPTSSGSILLCIAYQITENMEMIPFWYTISSILFFQTFYFRPCVDQNHTHKIIYIISQPGFCWLYFKFPISYIFTSRGGASCWKVIRPQ